MRYGASFLAYAIWVHKNATPQNWLMRVKELKVCTLSYAPAKPILRF